MRHGDKTQPNVGFSLNVYADVDLYSNNLRDYQPGYTLDDCFPGGYFKHSNTVATATNDKVVVSPNPAHEKISVQLPAWAADSLLAENVTIMLSDITGKSIKVIYDGNSVDMKGSFQLPDLTPGIYLLHIAAPHLANTQKLVIN